MPEHVHARPCHFRCCHSITQRDQPAIHLGSCNQLSWPEVKPHTPPASELLWSGRHVYRKLIAICHHLKCSRRVRAVPLVKPLLNSGAWPVTAAGGPGKDLQCELAPVLPRHAHARGRRRHGQGSALVPHRDPIVRLCHGREAWPGHNAPIPAVLPLTWRDTRALSSEFIQSEYCCRSAALARTWRDPYSARASVGPHVHDRGNQRICNKR